MSIPSLVTIFFSFFLYFDMFHCCSNSPSGSFHSQVSQKIPQKLSYLTKHGDICMVYFPLHSLAVLAILSCALTPFQHPKKSTVFCVFQMSLYQGRSHHPALESIPSSWSAANCTDLHLEIQSTVALMDMQILAGEGQEITYNSFHFLLDLLM